MLADALYEAGVRQLYGLPGDSIVALLDTLRVRGLQPTLVRHERWAAQYAQSDAAVNGRPSACFAGGGAGHGEPRPGGRGACRYRRPSHLAHHRVKGTGWAVSSYSRRSMKSALFPRASLGQP